MAIFNTGMFSNIEESYNDYSEIMPTIECGYEIAYNGYADMCKIIESLYISDVIIETQVHENTAFDAEILAENAVKDFVAKAVKKLKEIRDKIVAWFKRIVANIKVTFTSSKKFIDKYENKLIEKIGKVKSFTVKSRHKNYDKLHGTIKSEFSSVKDKILAHVKKVESGSLTYENTSDFNEALAKTINSKAGSIAELKAELNKELVGDVTTNDKIGAGEVKGMIKFCKDVKNLIDPIQAWEKETTKTINEFIKNLEGMKNEDNTAEIAKKVGIYNSATNVLQQISTLMVGIIKNVNKEYISILRSLMTYKPAKESFGDMMSENSIFESAMELI